MATKTLHYESAAFLPVAACGPVLLCLDPEVWSARTVSGLPFIQGTMESSGRFLGGGVMRGLLGMAFNPRNAGVYQYSVTYDDAQLLDDPGTDEPWLVTCEDITIQPSNCATEALLGLEERIDLFENPE